MDRTTFMVMEVVEMDPTLNFPDWLIEYQHRDFVWFVTRRTLQPESAQHNAHGQILSRKTYRPILGWTR